MKQISKKNTLFATLLAMTGTALPVSAAENLHVNVPFSFIVNGTRMDAGDYSVSPAGNNGVVTLTGVKNSVMVLTVPADYTSNSSLSFSASEKESVLVGVKLSGTSREIPVHLIADHKAALVSGR